MRKSILIFFIFIFSYKVYSQSFPLKLSRAGSGNAQNVSLCEAEVRVIDEKPLMCSYPNNAILFPVYIDNFDFKEDLPNNWAFNYAYTSDDDYDQGNNGHIWMGTSEEAYDNNLQVYDGCAHLILKKEVNTGKVAYPGASSKDYRFTGSALTSRFNTKQGVVKAKIKFPNNVTLWPAFWKRGYQEIDIFESWDDNLNPLWPYNSVCESYHQMRMHTHTRSPILNTKCVRGRKFPLESDFYSHTNNSHKGFHEYKCTFTESRIDFFLDSKLVGYANKFYDGFFTAAPACERGADGGIPQNSYGCSGVNILNDCFVNKPNSTSGCIIYKKIFKDVSFPNPNYPMGLRVSMAIRDIGDANNKYKINEDILFNSFNSYDAKDLEILVDRIEVWELVNCSAVHNLATIQGFYGANNTTGFLGGYSISVLNQANFVKETPSATNGWFDIPIHMLATEFVEFQEGAHVEIQEGAFLRAEIIDCNLGEYFSQRGLDKIESLNDSTFDISESFNKTNIAESRGSLTSSIIDNGSIVVYPNPTENLLNIEMVEEDYNDILYLELINSLGQKTRIERTKQLYLTDLYPGLYQLKFVFSHGFIVVKSINKQ